MADPIDPLEDILGPAQLSVGNVDDPLADILGPVGKEQPTYGAMEGMARQALHTGTLHADSYLTSPESQAKLEHWSKANPVKSAVADAAGFIAPMLTPAGPASLLGRAAVAMPRLAKLAEYVLPYSNLAKAAAPGAGVKTAIHQSGMGMLKAGAVMRANDPTKTPDEVPGIFSDGKIGDDPIARGIANGWERAKHAGDLKSMAWDYGLGGAGGAVGKGTGALVGGTAQKLTDQIPRFSWNRGTAGDGFYDWTRGGAQRAHDAITGDLRPGQSIEEAATHGMLGDFKMLQPTTRTKSGFAQAAAPHAYKYELAQRYSAAIDSGLTPPAARAKVAADIIADPALVTKYNLRGRGGQPAASTVQKHVNQVAQSIESSRQFPTTLQERIALSRGGETGKGAPTYGAAPNSFAAVDEMLTSPGSKAPGSARAEATNFVQQRQQTQNERVKAFLDEHLGEGDVHKALAAHEARKAAAYDFYDPAIANWKADPKAPEAIEKAVSKAIYDWRGKNDPALSVTQDVDKTIANLFERKVQPAPIEKAVETSNISRATGQPITRIESTPQLPEIRTPNQLQALIAQRSNFTREAEKVRLSDPSLYRTMQSFKKEHLDPAIRPLAPEWAAANDLAANAHALRRAFTAGESFPLGATSRQAEQLAKFNKMHPDHKEVFKSGLNAQLQKRLGAKTSTGDQHVLFAKAEVGDALRAIMGEQHGNSALQQLQAVAAATKTNKIFAQSATHGRESEERANSNILKLIQSVGNAAIHPIRGLGEIAKWGSEKMATEAQRARNDRALRILTANTDDLPNYFKQIKDVADSRRNHMPAVTQRLDESLRNIGAAAGVGASKRRDE